MVECRLGALSTGGRANTTTFNAYVTSIFVSISQIIVGSCRSDFWKHDNILGHNTPNDGNIIGWPMYIHHFLI